MMCNGIEKIDDCNAAHGPATLRYPEPRAMTKF
jgi:hypothetical protein